MNQKSNICLECGSKDIISPRRCDLGSSFITYCPKCDAVVESNEYYVHHALEEGQTHSRTFICSGCKHHMSEISISKEEWERENKIAMKIIEEILKEE